MSKWSRDTEDIKLDLAHAFGEGIDPLDAFGRSWERGSE